MPLPARAKTKKKREADEEGEEERQARRQRPVNDASSVQAPCQASQAQAWWCESHNAYLAYALARVQLHNNEDLFFWFLAPVENWSSCQTCTRKNSSRGQLKPRILALSLSIEQLVAAGDGGGA